MLYHGSSIGNLIELTPQISDHGKPYIYFVANPVIALFYTVKIVDKPYNWYPYGFKNGIPVYTEYYPDALADVYKGRHGYIYEFEKVENAENPTEINCVSVCTAPIKTEKITEIPDVYVKLLEHEKNGELVIERYETLSNNRLNQIRNMVKSEIEKYNLKNNDNSYSRFIKSRFKDLW